MVPWGLRSRMPPLPTLLAQLGARPGLRSQLHLGKDPTLSSLVCAQGGGEGRCVGARGTAFSIKGSLSRHLDSNLAPLLPDYVAVGKEFSLCGAQGMVRVTVIAAATS